MYLTELAIDLIDPPKHRHRTDFDADDMRVLVESIGATGLMNPIHVRPHGKRYEIIAGDRRHEAFRQLRRLTIPAFVLEHADNIETERARFTENLQRADLTPMEEAAAIDRTMRDCKLDRNAIAHMLRRSPRWVSDRLTLLELPSELQDALHRQAISTAAALALVEVDDDAHRAYLLQYAERNGAAAPVIRLWVQDYQQQKERAAGAPLPPPDTTRAPSAVVILMECALCEKQHPHTELQIIRVCIPCLKEIEK